MSISLRAYGYNSQVDANKRRSALQTAINATSFDIVHQRLAYVSNHCKSLGLVHADNMIDDLRWLSKLNDTVSLRAYGYSSMLPDTDRHNALQDAVADVGLDKVVDRLKYVVSMSATSNRKQVYESDISWLDDTYVPKHLKVPPPSPEEHHDAPEQQLCKVKLSQIKSTLQDLEAYIKKLKELCD